MGPCLVAQGVDGFEFTARLIVPEGPTIAGLGTLNMGAGGYGIDQAVLKYLLHGRAYRPDVVVLGVHTSNYWRSAVRFHAFAKPVLEVVPEAEPSTWRFTNRPVAEFDAVLSASAAQEARACRVCGAAWTLYTR